MNKTIRAKTSKISCRRAGNVLTIAKILCGLFNFFQYSITLDKINETFS